jgi:phage terminase small subunit
MKKLRLNRERQQRFVEALAATGNVSAAVKVAGTSRTRAYELRKTEQAFAMAWDEAEQVAADRLEAETWRRAVEGVEEPLVSGGKLVRDDDGQPIAVRRYSDQLLIALLRAHRPEKFRERAAVEIDISDRLADRLEAARRRAAAKAEPVVMLEHRTGDVQE